MEIGAAALPLATAFVAGGLAARLAGSAARRYSPAKVLWAAGLLAFAAGAAAEAYGAGGGWGPASFRAYYLAGGCLTVGLLGAGSAWRILPRDAALVLSGAFATACAGATISVLLADVDRARIVATRGIEPPPNGALGGHAFLWAIALNSAGSLLLGGGAVAALLRRRRVRANALVLAGILAVAASGTLTRLGAYGYVYLGQIAGLLLLAAGFELAERAAEPTPRRRPRGLGVGEAA